MGEFAFAGGSAGDGITRTLDFSVERLIYRTSRSAGVDGESIITERRHTRDSRALTYAGCVQRLPKWLRIARMKMNRREARPPHLVTSRSSKPITMRTYANLYDCIRMQHGRPENVSFSPVRRTHEFTAAILVDAGRAAGRRSAIRAPGLERRLRKAAISKRFSAGRERG
jgi:hypothetical protein